MIGLGRMYHILLTTDENFAQHCGVCIVSVLKNNPDSRFSFVVAGMGLSETTIINLTKCVEQFEGSKIEIIDFPKEKLDKFPQIGKYKKNIYLRLWIDEFFDEDVDFVLYLDADTIVVNPIDELFESATDDFILGAVDIPFSDSHNRCHLPLDYGYFNSGVVLFNVKRWRNENCRSQVLNFLIKNKEIALNPDQDALNGVFYKERLSLDYTYNLISPFFRKNRLKDFGESELSRVRENAKIIHFNGHARPWAYTCNHPYQKKYFDYLKLTPWNKYKCDDKTFINMIKKHLRRFLGIESFIVIDDLNGN